MINSSLQIAKVDLVSRRKRIACVSSSPSLGFSGGRRSMAFFSADKVENRHQGARPDQSAWKVAAYSSADYGSDEPILKGGSDASKGDASSKAPYPLTNVLLCVAAACAGAFAFGYHVAVVNGPLEAIAADLGFGGNKALEGAVVSLTLVGAAIGSLTGGGLADSFGRRTALLMACAPLMIGPLLSAWATGFQQMAVGRFVSGVAIGLTSAVVPTYINEVSPNSLRGSLGALNQLTICIGILAVLLVNVAMPPAQWRNFFVLAAAPAVLLLLGMLRSVESPHWLQSQGASASAQATSRQLWGPAAAEELGAAPAVSGGGKSDAVGWSDMFSPRFRKGFVMACVLFAVQQFAGINALVYFSTAVFRQAGVASDTLASAAVGATNVLGTLLAVSLIERAGRKQLLIGSYLGQGAAMLLMAAAFTLPALKDLSGGIAVVGTLAYILAFALGAGPITALIIPEFNAVQIKGRVLASALFVHWICNVILGQNFLAAVDKYGLASVYAAFGAVALTGALYIATQVPETKGKTNEQVALELNA